jgi:hypothetical protein
MANGGLPATRFVTVLILSAGPARKVKTSGLYLPDHDK